MKEIIFACGGTGGHIFPAIAIAEKLTPAGFKCHFMTEQRGVQYFSNHHLKTVSFIAKPGAEFVKKFYHLVSIGVVFLKSLIYFFLNRPAVVIGFGGYPSLPIVFAAQILKIPTVLHEQNALMGKANRFLQKRAKKVITTFTHTRFACTNSDPIGNPIRDDFKTLPKATNQKKDLFKLLVIGGSQGAQIFSEIVPQAIAQLSPLQQSHLSIVQQCRMEDEFKATKNYEKTKAAYSLKQFIENIAEEMHNADLIVSRSGASTCAEILFLEKPCLFVPLPSSVEGDQAENAQAFVEAGGALMCAQNEFSVDSLANRLSEIIENPEKLNDMKSALHNLKQAQHTDPAESVSNIIQDLLN